MAALSRNACLRLVPREKKTSSPKFVRKERSVQLGRHTSAGIINPTAVVPNSKLINLASFRSSCAADALHFRPVPPKDALLPSEAALFSNASSPPALPFAKNMRRASPTDG
uniref:TPX2_importin domain-containing protein n=1 Tax=Steinernema glaseri TaxID=37863 RepID=A0A1I7XZP4_9BILA